MKQQGSWVLAKTCETELEDTDREMIRWELQEASESTNLDFSREDLRADVHKSIFDVQVTWEIQLKDDSYLLKEKHYFPHYWEYLLILALATSSVWPMLILFNTNLILVFLTAYFANMCYLAWSLPKLWSEKLIPKLRGNSTGHSTSSPYLYTRRLRFALLTSSVPAFLLRSSILLFATSIISLVTLAVMFPERDVLLQSVKDESVAAHLFHAVLPSDSAEGSEDSGSWSLTLPAVTTQYILMSLIIASSGILGLAAILFLPSYMRLLFVPIICPFLLINSCIVINTVGNQIANQTLDTFFSVNEGIKQQHSSLQQAAWIVTAVSISYLGIGSAVRFLYEYRELYSGLKHVSTFEEAALVTSFILLIVFSVLPTTYFALGLQYQVRSAIRQFLTILFRSEPLNAEIEGDIKLRKLDTDRKSPVSLTTGFSSYVVIPSRLVQGENKLSDQELKAVVAHEKSHIRNGEAFLQFVLPFMSALLLTGQNVFFGILNFRKRELRADRDAARETNAEAVISSLETLRDFDSESSSTNDDEEKSWSQKYLTIFYGTYAMSNAHPSDEERIDELEAFNG